MYALGMKKFIGHQGKTSFDIDFEMLTVKNVDNTPVNLSDVMENAMVVDDYKTFDSILDDVKKTYPEYFI
jgi:predicted Zn-dependent protease with MMP-like domain